MKILVLISVSLFMIGCGAKQEPTVPSMDTPELPPEVLTDEFLAELNAKEPPMFLIDQDAVGPLTMNELQVDLPSSVERRLSKRKQACFMEQVEKLVAEAGDPETLDPEALSYLYPKEQWPSVSSQARRGLLAQAVMSHALNECT
ncbi:MAG: hypothetical protein AB8F65_07645 [Woeseiaceae bacterium]